MGEHSSARGRGFSLRLRAVLAAGVVLGLGVTATLASWNDSEFATGSFATSVFNTESNVQSAGYADNAASPGPTVTFAGAGLSPNTSAYFTVLVRTKATSIAGTVSLAGATVGGADAATLGTALVYRVVATTGTCAASAFLGSPSWVVGAASTYRALTAGQEIGVSTSLAAATVSLPGAATGFCFEVTLPSGALNTLQGKTATATWQFTATSV
jgi:predicted ribosomally synthesized peptide with SipW-like signal peptide